MPEVRKVARELTAFDKWDHLTARLGYKRMSHRVEPGLYSVGSPDGSSPVFVSANYTLSFDALRSSLAGIDAHILVLDTKGINVWCAAGKGTFSTDEIAHQVEASGLKEVVSHRTLVLPQLGAPGVCAHEVKRRTGFNVRYGPVRAEDIPEFMRTGEATEEMRTVRFQLRDRAVLVPVEVKNYILPLLLIPVALLLLGGWFPALVALVAIIGGLALFPLLLPYLPTPDFTSKGVVLGALLALPLSFYAIYKGESAVPGLGYGAAIALILIPIVAYMALNFTGCSTYASRTGVRREIFTYIPPLAAMLAIGGALLAMTLLGDLAGWW